MRLLLVLLLVLLGPAGPASAAEWSWPLDGAVIRPFVPPAHRYAAGHRGADLASAPGAAVRAAGDGWVSYAGLVAGRGVVVVVHGPLRTTYEPVSALVRPGDLVAAGEVLGTLEAGHAGCPALACLHWGLRRGDDYLDPVRLVRPGPVRLLPLEVAPPAAALRFAAALAGGPGAEEVEPVPAAAVEEAEPVLAPAGVRDDRPRMSRLASAGLVSTAVASALGAAAAARRRR